MPHDIIVKEPTEEGDVEALWRLLAQIAVRLASDRQEQAPHIEEQAA